MAITWNPHDDFITLSVACIAAPGFWKIIQGAINHVRGKKSVEKNLETVIDKMQIEHDARIESDRRQAELEKNVIDIQDKMRIEHDARVEADRRQREISTKISAISNGLNKEHDEREANDIKNARTRIIRFNDELLSNVPHSKSMFDSVLIDCSDYEDYCEYHPHFKNNVAVEAIENIKRIYRKCEENHDFL